MYGDVCEPQRRSRLPDVPIVRIDRRLPLGPRDSDDLSIERELCPGRVAAGTQIACSKGVPGHRSRFDGSTAIKWYDAEPSRTVGPVSWSDEKVSRRESVGSPHRTK